MPSKSEMKQLKKEPSSTTQLALTFESETPTDAESVMRMLWEEFEFINSAHFNGTLKRPQIILSRRKAYGGYYQPRLHKIVLSWQAFEEHGWEETLNTFRHEVAHIIHPNHSKLFWELATFLGAHKRYASQPIKAPKTPHKYVYECPNCARKYYRNRRFQKASCGICDKGYNPAYALRLIKK